MATGSIPSGAAGKKAAGETTPRLRPRHVLWAVAVGIGIIAAGVAIALIFFPIDDSPIVDPKKKRLVEAARAEFVVPSSFELSQLEAIPTDIPDQALDSVEPESVAVAICPELSEGCDAEGPDARLFFLHHVVQYGRDGHSDFYDFVFRRRDQASPSAAQQEFRYRTGGSGGAVAALVIRPTDWNHDLRRNQIAYLPDFLDTDLGAFLFENRMGSDVQRWGNVAGVATTCVGYCPAPMPSIRERITDRITTWLNMSVAYMETERGRNLILALCAIVGVFLAFLTFLLKRAEFALAKEQMQADEESPEPGNGVREGLGQVPT